MTNGQPPAMPDQSKKKEQKKLRGTVITIVVVTALLAFFVLCMVQMFHIRAERFQLSPKYQEFQERWAEQHDPSEPSSLLSLRITGDVGASAGFH